MVKSNALSMLAAGRLIVRRFAGGCISREGSLCEDLREDAYRGKAHRERTCVRGVTTGERNDGEKNGRQAEHGVKRGG